jgi:Leucine-rich repeat (LRR) protein
MSTHSSSPSGTQFYTIIDGMVAVERGTIRRFPAAVAVAVVILRIGCVIGSRHHYLSSINVPQYEISALQDLYDSTNGPGWVWTPSEGNPWTFTTGSNPCSQMWQGVLCTNDSSQPNVEGLFLSAMNLVGTIPNTIGMLSKLHVLYLDTNSLYGTLPESISNCTELGDLSLYTNALSGTIPESYMSLSQLQIIQLLYNKLSGELPDIFGNMSLLYAFNVQFNEFEGCLPLSLTNCSALQEIAVNDNNLHCYLPDEFAQLTQLTYFNLYDNNFYGTFSPQFGRLTQLQFVQIYNNQFTGTLPDTLCDLRQLQHYMVGENYFTGTIPDCVGSLKYLTSLEVDQNLLSGTLPGSVGGLPYLSDLILFSNALVGTLSPSLANCTYMYNVMASDNHFTGTLPAPWGQWQHIAFIELQNNQLSGPLPESLSSLPYLYLLELTNNKLTGTVPAAYQSLVYMTFIVLAVNDLTGAIPPQLFDQMDILYSVDFSHNMLSGSIPPGLGNAPKLQYCNLYGNSFTGTLPAALGNAKDLQFLFLYDNSITGSIPDSFGGMAFLEQLYIDYNYLTGSIPASLAAVEFLQFLILDLNMLTGRIPPDFSQAAYLIGLLMHNNHLTGTLDGVFNATMQTELLTLGLNDNQLSGTLPAELFRLPKLNSLSAVSNCFHGQVPLETCNSSLLVTLALDGLSSASSCRDRLLPGLSKSYVIHDSKVGTIPPCLFRMPILTTLHLSGNGLTGSIPDVPSESYLLDLSLSHNQLTGMVPPHMQQRQWLNLDLSYNRLEGSLRADFESQHVNASFYDRLSKVIGKNVTAANAESTLSLETNRLSGRIPRVLQSMQNVSILGSNVFSCDVTESNLPQYDSGRGNYQCGSDSFNVPFYLWLALLCVSLASTWAVHRYQEVIQRYVGIEYALNHVYKWYYVLEDHRELLGGARLSAYRRVLQLGEALCLLGLRCTGYMLLVLMPIYAACSHYRGTILHQYAWTLSAAYLTGWMPAILMQVFLVALVAYAAHAILTVRYKQLAATRDGPSRTVSAAATRVDSTAVVVFIYGLFLTVNLFVVVGANTAYVVAAIYGDRRVLFPAQLGLSLFKLLWNRFFSVYLIRWTARLKALVGVPATEVESEDQQQSAESQFVSLQMFVALLNNIAVPCLVVAVVSPSCFYNVFTAAPAVSATFVYQACALVQGSTCLYFQPATTSTSYNPPFTYSYQCSSSFITYYAPTFVLLCLLRAFVSPLQQFLVYHLHRRSASGTRWNALLDSLLLPNLKSIVPGQAARRDVFKPFFDANQLLLSLVTYLGILLTFGAVFPPVALAILVTLLAVFHFNKLKVNRFIRRAVEQQQLDYVDVVEAESARAGFLPVLQRAAWMLVTVSCWFYTLFLFDTLGDAVGFGGAYWVLIVMLLMPLVLYVVYKFIMCATQRHKKHSSGGLADHDVAIAGQPDHEAGMANMIEMGPTGELAGATVNVLQQLPAE